MKRIVLFVLDRFRAVFSWLGIDYPQLRAIVEIKLLMDTRRQPVAFGQQATGKETNSSAAYWVGIVMYALFGAAVGALMFLVPSVYLALTAVFSYVMLMTVMTLIGDFASVLMDTTDHAVLAPRPVDNRTVWMARIIHVVSYVFSYTLALSLFPIVFVGIRYGAAALLLFVVLVFLSALLAVFFTNLLYVLLIRFSSEARVRQVVTYAQVLMSIVFIGGAQVLPRLINIEAIQKATASIVWWHYLLPPCWMGGIMDAFVNRHFEVPYQAFVALAVLFPAAALWVMNSAVSRDITRKLLAASTADSGETAAGAETQKTLSERLSAWLTRHPAEKMGFELTWKITGRDQKFKVRTYPSMGILLPVYFSFFRTGIVETSTWQHILVLYFLSLLVSALLTNSQLSDDYRAAWLYTAPPLQQPGKVLLGSLKALVVKLFAPLYLVISVFVVWLWGWHTVGDIVLAFCNNLLFVTVFAMAGPKRFPFSAPPVEAQQSSNFAVAMLMLILSSIVGLAHFGLSQFPVAVWVAIPVMGALVFYLLRKYGETSWERVRATAG